MFPVYLVPGIANPPAAAGKKATFSGTATPAAPKADTFTAGSVDTPYQSKAPFPQAGFLVKEGKNCSEADIIESGKLIGGIEEQEFPKNGYTVDSETAYMRQYANTGRSYVFVVKDPTLKNPNDPEGTTVGTATIGPADGDTAYIPTIYVNKDYRRKGFGEWMMKGLLQKAREMGYKKATLMTSKTIAPLMYAKLGFVETNQPGARMKNMVKDLSKYIGEA